VTRGGRSKVPWSDRRKGPDVHRPS
jgi:hypothetical protein